jgi:ribonuclease R
MKFTVADLLDQLSTDESLPPAHLEKALGVTAEDDQAKLRIGLEALERLALVERGEEGVRRRECPELIPARLRCSSKGFCFALRDDEGEDIYIRDHQLNHAWNGDRVLVRITRDGGRRRSPEGSVQCILQRHTTRLLGHVERQGERLVAVPLDDRLLTAVALPDGDASHLDQRDTHVVEVQIDKFPVAQFAPEGHVARSLPVSGGDETDLELLMVKHQLLEGAGGEGTPGPHRSPHPGGETVAGLRRARHARPLPGAERGGLASVGPRPRRGRTAGAQHRRRHLDEGSV